MKQLLKKIPQVHKCCCGCTLETGTTLFAWIQLVSSIFIFVMTFSYCLSLIALYETSEGTQESVPILFVLIVSAVVAALEGFDVALAAFLLMCIHKRQVGKIKIWLYSEIILFIINVVVRSVNFLGLLGINTPQSELYTYLFQNIVELCYIFYFIVVVKSFYFEKTGMSHYETPTSDEETGKSDDE